MVVIMIKFRKKENQFCALSSVSRCILKQHIQFYSIYTIKELLKFKYSISPLDSYYKLENSFRKTNAFHMHVENT